MIRLTRLHRIGDLGAYAMLAPAVLAVGALAASLCFLAWMAFHEYDAFLNEQGALSLENVTQVLGSTFYREVFVRTVIVSAIVTLAAVALGLPFAYGIVRSESRVLRTALLATVFVPFLVGEIVRAYGWLVLVGGAGIVSWFSELAGLGDRSLLGTPLGVSLGLLQLMLPLCTLVLLPAIHAIDPELEQASAVLGARGRHSWMLVIAPLAKPGLVAAAAVSFTLCMTSIATPALLGNGQYDFTANTIMSVYFVRGNSHVASALGLAVLIITVCFVAAIFVLGGRTPRWAPASGQRTDARGAEE